MEDLENINDSKVINELQDSKPETSIQDILVSLISDKDNLTLKTEIQNPKALASLYILKSYFERIKCPITAGIIDDFIEIYLEYMVSNKRKSRKEIIKALSSWIEKEYSSISQNKMLVGSERAVI